MIRLVTAQCGIFAVSSTRDEERDREEVEQPMGEDRAEQGRARAAPEREVPAQHGDARELAGARRQHRVPEQPDPEGGEDLTEARVRLGQRLVDRQPPRERAREDRGEVEQDGDDHPAPRHEVERVVDAVPVGATPPDRERRRSEQGEARAGRAPRDCERPRRAASRRAPRVALDALRRCPRAGARCHSTRTARSRAPAPPRHRDAPRLVGEERSATASTSAAGSSGGTVTAVSGVVTSR